MSSLENFFLIIIFIFLLILNIKIIWIELKLNVSQNLYTALFYLIFFTCCLLLPLVAHIINGGTYSLIKDSNSINVSFYTYIYYQINCAAIILGYFFTKKKYSVGATPYFEFLSVNPYPFAMLVVIGSILLLIGSGQSIPEMIVSDRFSWMNSEFYSPFIFNLGGYFCSFVALTLFYCFTSVKRYKFIIFLVITILIILTVVFRNRALIIMLLSGLLGSKYFNSGKRIFLTSNVIIGTLAALFFLFFWQFLRATLYVVSTYGSDLFISFAYSEFIKILLHGDLIYFYSSSIEAISQFFYYDNVSYFNVFRRAIFFFIPHEYSFGLKPVDLSIIFSEWLDQGDHIRQGNMPPGFIGSFVLSFGFFSAFILFLFPRFLNLIDCMCKKNQGFISHILISFAFFASLYLIRGDDSSSYIFIFFQIFVISIMLSFYKLLHSKS